MDQQKSVELTVDRPKTITRMRQLRRQKELTLKQLGALVGLGHSTVAAIEQGDVKPSYDSAKALATALGCSMEELLELVEVPV